MKRYLALLMAILCFASVLAIPMEAAAPRIIGKVYTTDIRAYINGAEIPAYNIDGNMVIVGSDLRNYGFSVVYDNNKRTSSVTLPKTNNNWTPMTNMTHYSTIGKKVMDVYATDIKVLINGKEVQAYNVDNKMAFKFSELKVFGDYKYDNATRTTNLTVTGTSIPIPVEYDFLDVLSSYNYYKMYNEDVGMGGVKYSGFSLSAYYNGYAYFNLSGQYTKLTGFVGCLDGAKCRTKTVRFYGDDILICAIDVKAGDLPIEFTLNTAGVRKLKIDIIDKDDPNYDDHSLIGFGDLKITKYE